MTGGDDGPGDQRDAAQAGAATEYEWTAQVTVDAALDANRDVSIAVTCRGSAHPVALDWLIAHLEVARGRWLDVGAGLGGPSAYLERRTGIVATLVEPAGESAKGAARLHGLPVIRGAADALPTRPRAFGRAWALGVLSATMDPLVMLVAIADAVRPGGRLGLLEYVSTTESRHDPTSSNTFLSPTALGEAARRAGWHPIADEPVASFGPTSDAWVREQDGVDREIAQRYATHEHLQQSKRREEHVAKLLEAGVIAPHLFVFAREDDRAAFPR